MVTATLRELVLLEKGRVTALHFADSHERATVRPIGEAKTIVWPSVYSPNSVEDNAPSTADAYRFLGEPSRTLTMSRNVEEVSIRYYRLAKK